ncbi:MAG: DUF4450 domain-containing protein [Pirellulaceae bacterium]
MHHAARWLLGNLTCLFVMAAICDATADDRHYHLRRAVFRGSPLNRGLGFDGQHFWVGEFGGWVRCYDLQGQRVPARDLGGGTIQYLGHGIATSQDFIATCAWESLAILSRDTGEIRHVKSPLPGKPCGVATTGDTLWVMNYESPVLYELTLDGQLLRQFDTAQQLSVTSHDIAIDCDNHIYVLEGLGSGSRKLFEYAPDGTLLRTHSLAVPATGVAIDPQDQNKTLYTLSFAGEPIVYEYERALGVPRDGPLPRLMRPLRYRPEGQDIVITNGANRFNRPLYGTHSAFFAYAGDKPEVMLSLPGKGGTLWLGIVAAGADQGTGELPATAAGKWLSDADQMVTRYRAGAMRYEIADDLLKPGGLVIDVIPSAATDGAQVKVAASAGTPPLQLVWAFGGASGLAQWNLDSCGYTPEEVFLLKPEDCSGNVFQLKDAGFELLAPCHQNRPLVGIVPTGSRQKIADANQLSSPLVLWNSTPTDRPIVMGQHTLRHGEPLHLAFDWSSVEPAALEPGALPAAFDAAESRRREIAERVRVQTPDPYMNAAAAAICAAADGIWEPPVYMHGGVAWHMPYLGWRGAYVASEFGWHDRAQMHFRAFGDVQLKEPVTGQPHADPEMNLARQSSKSVMFSRGYIPVHPTKDARHPYDMQQIYIDQLLWHLLWTGDLDFARQMWPVLVDHLHWEKRCFDPNDDGLYENVANTFISDAHHYSGSGCTQASAYNYRAYSLAGTLARLLGEDPAPWEAEAKKIHEALNRVLWMPRRGWYAEYQDLLGLQRLHPSAELPSIYHPIDSDVPDLFQAWQMLRYVDTSLERFPIDSGGTMLASSNWVPYIWSVREVSGVEVAHTALANWQVGRRVAAYDLWRGAILDSMYGCRAPGACIGTSEQTGRMAGLCTDFADTVGMYGRTLVEGLFGIVPDALSGQLLIRPGLPSAWESAAIDTPDVGYTYARQGDAETFDVRARFRRPMQLRLRVAARSAGVLQVTANGQPVTWRCVSAVGEPAIEVDVAQADGAHVVIRWTDTPLGQLRAPAMAGLGETIRVDVAGGPAAAHAAAGNARLCEVIDPQRTLDDLQTETTHFTGRIAGEFGHRTLFARLEQGTLSWWQPWYCEVRPAQEVAATAVDWEQGEVHFTVRNNTSSTVAQAAHVRCGDGTAAVQLDIAPHGVSSVQRLPAQGLVSGTNPLVIELQDGQAIAGKVVDWRTCDTHMTQDLECVDLTSVCNDRVTEIFKHDYLSPRSPYCSLQIPLHGFGDWCYCGRTVPMIDDAALRAAAGTANRLLSPQGIPFATPGPGEQPNIVFTSRWDNFPAEMTIPLTGRARHVWFLVTGSTHPMHSQLDNGELVVAYVDGTSTRLPLHNPSTWWPIEADYDTGTDGFCIPGPYPPRIDLGQGRATILDLPLDPQRELQSLTVRCLANDVVVGLMSATLQRR